MLTLEILTIVLKVLYTLKEKVMAASSKISVYFTQDGLLIKVVGKGIVDYCRDLKEEIEKLLSEYTKINLYFDLSETTHLDSTFIGLIVMFDRKLSSSSKGVLYILDPSVKVMEILSTMDLLDILKITNIEVNIIGKYRDIEPNIKRDIVELKLLIQAHENLIQTSPKSKEKFQMLENALKEELKKYENKK